MKGIGLFATVLVGCSGSDLTSTQYDDIAAIVGAGIATPDRGGDLGAITDSLTIARGDLPKGFFLNNDGSVTGTRGGIDYRYNVICLDVWGADLSACDPPASTAIVQARWTGQLDMAAFDGPMTRQGVWWLTHLNGPMGQAAGTTTLTAQSATFEDPHRTYWVQDDQDLLMFADMASLDMMGGTVTSTIAVTTADADYIVAAELTLESPANATLYLDDRDYTVDLDTGAVSRGAYDPLY